MQGYFCKSTCLRIVLMLALVFCLATTALAADSQNAGTSVYCFSENDFQDQDMTGIFVLSVPDDAIGKICYGDRVIRSGDVLTREALSTLTLKTNCTDDARAEMTYLPVYSDQLGERASWAVSIRSGKAGVPVAKDLKLETYKNMANDGVLQATDEGGGALTFTIVTQPAQGKVEVDDSGKFVYTPDKNKVGDDSFTYTATDSDGNTSEPAKVSITILKPTDEASYSDMTGRDDAFEAQWLRETGLFTPSNVGGLANFSPDEPVSRGEFLVMAMKLMGIEGAVSGLRSGFVDEADAPNWMRPYLVQAMRYGYVNGYPGETGLVFCPNDPVTYATASVMLQNMLQLKPTGAAEVFSEDIAVPVWAEDAISTLRQYALPVSALSCTEPMTRSEAANLLYAASSILENQ